MLRHLVASGMKPERAKGIAFSYLENFEDKNSVGFKHCKNLINSFDPDKVHDNYSAVVKAAAERRGKEQSKRTADKMKGSLGVAISERRNESAKRQRTCK